MSKKDKICEERVFGLTLENVGELKKSVCNWTDHNSLLKTKPDGGNFITAFNSGAELLHKDEAFLNVFKSDKDK